MSIISSNDSTTIRYLALGDSYTIGESVLEEDRWPKQLSALLQVELDRPIETTIIAKTGWTTDELMSAIKTADLGAEYDLVSLLIGVNNQYRGYDIHQYQKEFEELLTKAIDFAGGNKKTVFVLSIPDYGVTPFARNKDPDKIAIEVDQYNKMAEVICIEYQVSFYDITAISKKAEKRGHLIAEDGLHPSGKMYDEWVRKVYPEVLKLF